MKYERQYISDKRFPDDNLNRVAKALIGVDIRLEFSTTDNDQPTNPTACPSFVWLGRKLTTWLWRSGTTMIKVDPIDLFNEELKIYLSRFYLRHVRHFDAIRSWRVDLDS